MVVEAEDEVQEWVTVRDAASGGDYWYTYRHTHTTQPHKHSHTLTKGGVSSRMRRLRWALRSPGRTYTHVYVHIYTYKHTQEHTHTYACIQTEAHAHTQAQTHRSWVEVEQEGTGEIYWWVVHSAWQLIIHTR